MKFKAVVNQGGSMGFVVVRNDSGGTLNKGQVVVWDMAGTEDGFRVRTPAAGLAQLVVGLARSATPDGDKGLIQTYGLCEHAVVQAGAIASNSTGSIGAILDFVSTGTVLTVAAQPPNNLLTQVASNSVASICWPYFVLCQTNATATDSDVLTETNARKVFIRCL